MKKKFIATFIALILISFPVTSSLAITEADNGTMKVYNPGNYGFEYSWLRAFDIKGYIKNSAGKTLISSTFGNHGYHTFLNVNGKNGEMSGELSYTSSSDLSTKLQEMQYTAYDKNNEVQTIDGINLKVTTKYINNGEQLQIIYTLKNTTDKSAKISLATTADVQIDGDDSATIERLENSSGVKLWTKKGRLKKPVQFVFYGKDVPGTTSIDNPCIGRWGYKYFTNMFNNNPSTSKIENRDSAFTFSWVNRTINAGETKTYSVLMEVGEINIPNTGLTLDNNTKFYYKDVKMNGTIIDKDLKDKITVHYIVDGTEYTLPTMSTTGSSKAFTLDLTSLNLSATTKHSLKVWATDSTGCDSNVEERTFTITYLKEPEVKVSTDEWSNDVTFKIKDTINEQKYVDKYQYRINNGNWIDCLKDSDIPINECGNNTIDVRILGTQSGDYSNIVTVKAKVDTANPTAIAPTATKTTSSITVNSKQTDEHSGIDSSKTLYAIKKDGVWSNWQSENTFTGLIHNTEYTVKTKSTDFAGNTSESEEFSIKTDELLLGDLVLKSNNNNGNEYTNNTWTNQNIYIDLKENSAGATTTYKSKYNSAQEILETNKSTTVTKDGITTIVLSVTDGTNTVTSDVEHILKIDKSAPVINSITLDKVLWSKDSKKVTGKAIDTVSGITAYQFSDKSDLTNSSAGWIGINTSTHEITKSEKISKMNKSYFYVKDSAGNVASVSIDTKIDSQGPIITFVKSDNQTSINVTDTGSGIKNTYYAWSTENVEPSDDNWQEYSSAITYEGATTKNVYLWAKSSDNADNTTISSTAFDALDTPVDENSNDDNSESSNSNNENVNSDNGNIDSTDGTIISDNGNGNLNNDAIDSSNGSGNSNNNIVNSDNKNSNSDTSKSQSDSLAVGTLPKTGRENFTFMIIVALSIYCLISLYMYKRI